MVLGVLLPAGFTCQGPTSHCISGPPRLLLQSPVSEDDWEGGTVMAPSYSSLRGHPGVTSKDKHQHGDICLGDLSCPGPLFVSTKRNFKSLLYFVSFPTTTKKYCSARLQMAG